MMLHTTRMSLLPASLELARAEIADHHKFGVLLKAVVPPNWPPENLADALPFFLKMIEADASQIGWLVWYGLYHDPELASAVLVGASGFRGPAFQGTVEIGYSVLPQFQGLGFATEMVGGLLEWAFQHSHVKRVIAEAEQHNAASIRVLEKHYFVADGPGAEPGHLRFVRQPAENRPA